LPLEGPPPAPGDRATALNAALRGHGAASVIEHALTDPRVGRIALVSSFGAESVALLHLVAAVDRTVPVLFLETGMLFAETLAYQRRVAERLGLTDMRVLRPGDLSGDSDGALHRTDPDACCAMRKMAPLAEALGPFDAWMTGRKRHQGGRRAALEFFEAADGRLKVNPLARWTPADVQDYIADNGLPRHPLVAKGYPSIGCAPCTQAVAAGEDARAGRWRGTAKTECGIHFQDGRAVRRPIRRDAA
jgi:phosphoadenosine phosphosulfate reductase